MTTPQLSILIVNYNGKKFLGSCLESIPPHFPATPYEVIIIDNASTDQSAEWVKNNYPWVHVESNTRNLGFSAAINQAFKASRGKYLLWLNPDTEFLDNWFPSLIEFLEKNPGAGIAGPKILNTDGSLQLSHRDFPARINFFFNRYSLLTRFFPQNPWSRKYLHSDQNPQRAVETDWVSGSCLLHRREVLSAVEGLDEGYFMYMEDVDFCKRARAANWKSFYVPTSSVLHHIGASSRQLRFRTIRERHQSIWLYYKKYLWVNPAVDFLVFTVLQIRLAFYLLIAFLNNIFTQP